VAAFPALSTHQHRTLAPSRGPVRFPHTRGAPRRELIRGCPWRGQLSQLARYQDVQVTVERQEETLEIEYIESVMPPAKLAALPHEEWVSSISAFVPGSEPFFYRFDAREP